MKPRVAWFQLGIRHDAAAETLARAGIRVVQDRCLLVEHRRLASRVMAGLAARLAPIVLPDADGRPVRLGSLWADAPAALVFLRHYG